MTVPAGSHDDFFADVRRFFSLLDLDGDGLLSWGEATLGLHHCFDAVHRVRSPSSASASASSSSTSPFSSSLPSSLPAVSASHKQRVVASQVSWLFSATQHAVTVPAAGSSASPSGSASADAAALSLGEFESCYHRLLQSAYEQEVLWLDLKRGIGALSSSAQWQSMGAVCSRARRLWAASLQQLQQQGSGMQLQQHQGGSRQEAAERQRLVDRIVQNLQQQQQQLTHRLQPMRDEAPRMTEQSWMRSWHDLLLQEGDTLDLQQLCSVLDAELDAARGTESDAATITDSSSISRMDDSVYGNQTSHGETG